MSMSETCLAPHTRMSMLAPASSVDARAGLRRERHVEGGHVDAHALGLCVQAVERQRGRQLGRARQDPHVADFAEEGAAARVDNRDLVAGARLPVQLGDPIGTVERAKEADLQLATLHLLGLADCLGQLARRASNAPPVDDLDGAVRVHGVVGRCALKTLLEPLLESLVGSDLVPSTQVVGQLNRVHSRGIGACGRGERSVGDAHGRDSRENEAGTHCDTDTTISTSKKATVQRPKL
mmetsp:Transcript_52016/g.144064  ORF Transcript_52016/g.144064 Transcript_52016/m.144064 type:complete len:237 (-) Transcript_52016:22-732(-)